MNNITLTKEDEEDLFEVYEELVKTQSELESTLASNVQMTNQMVHELVDAMKDLKRTKQTIADVLGQDTNTLDVYIIAKSVKLVIDDSELIDA